MVRSDQRIVRAVLSRAQELTDVSPDEVMSRSHRAVPSDVRRAAMLALRRERGWGRDRVASAFGRAGSTTSNALTMAGRRYRADWWFRELVVELASVARREPRELAGWRVPPPRVMAGGRAA